MTQSKRVSANSRRCLGRCRVPASPAACSGAVPWGGCRRCTRRSSHLTGLGRVLLPSVNERCCRCRETTPQRSRRQAGDPRRPVAGRGAGQDAALRRWRPAGPAAGPGRPCSTRRVHRPSYAGSRPGGLHAACRGDRRPGSAAGPPGRSARAPCDRCEPARTTAAIAADARPAAETPAATASARLPTKPRLHVYIKLTRCIKLSRCLLGHATETPPDMTPPVPHRAGSDPMCPFAGACLKIANAVACGDGRRDGGQPTR
jgi:hypothetical protein